MVRNKRCMTLYRASSFTAREVRDHVTMFSLPATFVLYGSLRNCEPDRELWLGCMAVITITYGAAS